MCRRTLKYLLTLSIIPVLLFSCNQEFDNEITGDEQEDWNIEDVEIENSEDFRNTISDALAENKSDHEASADYSWDAATEVAITLNENSISVSGNGASVDGTTVTIQSAGNYRITGTLDDGQILVETEDEEIVRLILNGINISNSSSAPIYVSQAEKTLIYLEAETENFVSDATTYVFENADEDEPNAAIFSKDDLSIGGTGSLTVTANYNDGIASKDGLLITNGKISVNSVDDGIRGKDYLIVRDGEILVEADGDGLKSDNDEDATRGYIYIENGYFDISSGGDAVQAKTDVLIASGTFSVTAGSGSTGSYSSSTSLKGLKASVNLIVENGEFSVSTSDDALHSNGSLVIHDGTFNISSGDDGIHADGVIYIYDGTIDITKSYEGIESTIINISGGDIHVVASDDGLNVAGGNDGSGFGRPGEGNFSGSSDYYIFITGGRIVIDAMGDGLDSNGSISMTDGTVIVNGPTANNNGAIDYDGSFAISGGLLVAVGSAGMAEAPGNSSSQYSLLINLSSSIKAGTIFHIQDSDGNDILNFAPIRYYQSVVFSSPDLVKGNTYEVYYGGSYSGTEQDGLYTDGTYSDGTNLGSITISSMVTKVSSR